MTLKKGQRVKIIGDINNSNRGHYKGHLGNVKFVRGEVILVDLDFFPSCKMIKLNIAQVVPFDG